MKVSEIEQTSSSGNLTAFDQRFDCPDFCDAVCQVMWYLGIEITEANFGKYDKILNWHAVAQSIVNPVHVARCYMLWGRYHKRWWKSETDRRIYKAGKPVVVCKDLHGKTAEEALAGLDTEAYEFIEWWG